MSDTNKIEIEAEARFADAQSEVKKLEGSIKAVGESGKKTSITLNGAFREIKSGISKVKQAISMVSFATMWIDATTSIIQKFSEWREEIRKSRVEADKLKEAAKFNEQMKSVDDLSAGYTRLRDAIGEAAKAAADAERQASAATDATRAQQDADLALRQEREIAALDRSDPAYREKVAEIQTRYAGARSALGAKRKVEDAERKRQAYASESDAALDESAGYELHAEEATSEARRMSEMAERWRAVEKISGMKDRQKGWIGFMGKYGKRAEEEFYGTVRNMTADEMREYASGRAAEYEKAGETASGRAKEALGMAEQAKARSASSWALSQTQGAMVEAAKTQAEAVRMASGRALADAGDGVMAAQEREKGRIADDFAKEAELRRREADEAANLASAQDVASSMREQIGSAQARISENSAAMMGNAFTLTANGGSAAAIAEANAALANENSELEGMIREFTRRLNEATRIIERAQNQSRASLGVDSTEGA